MTTRISPLVTCYMCKEIAPPLLCHPGRTLVYGAEEAECSRFETDSIEFDARIEEWTTIVATNASTTASGASSSASATPSITGSSLVSDAYPGCRDALEVFFCAQQPVYQAGGLASPCSEFRRPFQGNDGRCLSFCVPIRDMCPPSAHTMCEDHCRSAAFSTFCNVLEISGLDTSRWDEDTLDIMNTYRLEAEQDVPLLRGGRPYYRSIPARRPAGSARATKLDYYLYATNTRGYTEWLLDTDDVDTDGAVAYVSDSTLTPYRVSSVWTVWSAATREWSTSPLTVTCRDDADDEAESSAPSRHAARHVWGATLAASLAALQVVGWRGVRGGGLHAGRAAMW